MNSINPVGPLRESPKSGQSSHIAAGQKPGVSFKETLNSFFNDVNKMQIKADESIEKMAAGEITDVHQVMSTVQEANISFNMMMEIRNKVMDAYQEVMRLRL